MTDTYTLEVARFLEADRQHPLFGLVYGRRRIGKSTMLHRIAADRTGFYYEATRGESSVQLHRLGRAVGEFLGVGRIAYASWDEAFSSLLGLGAGAPIPVVLDEFGHLLESDRTLESVLAAALGPAARSAQSGAARLICCGSAISVMRSLTNGQAPLRGRAGIELIMYPDDFRVAAARLPVANDAAGWLLATHVFAVIGGVVGYATDMVNFDLPVNTADFERWIVERVLAPSSILLHEGTTLLAEDPAVSGAGALVHHSILSAVANGAVTAGAIAKRLGKQVSNLAPALNRLVDAGFVVRHEDPLRDRRPTYELDDPFLRFHFAVIDPYRALLRDRGTQHAWTERLRATFDSGVRGPVFEEMARTWVRRFAAPSTTSADGESGDALIGPSAVSIDGVEHQLDIAVAASGEVPNSRTVLALGEAKAGEELTPAHLTRLERARAAFGPRAAGAKLLLFGTAMTPPLRELAERRHDVELIDLERLYAGS